MSRLGTATAAIVLAAGLSQSGTAAPAARSEAGTVKECAHLRGHIYEVCFAYMVNCVGAALGPYYKFGHSSNLVLRRFVLHRFRSRYVGQARRLIENRTRRWPLGITSVWAGVYILSVKPSLAANSAQITSRESWFINYDRPGGTLNLYTEVNFTHRITMRRVPGLVVHKWVVSRIG